MTPIECTCNPGVSHLPIVSTDAKLLRQVRKDSLAWADEWERDGEAASLVICARWKAHMCLIRLRELRRLA